MRIAFVDKENFADLCDFNSRSFPEKKIESNRYLEFWLSKYDVQCSDNLILLSDNETVVGQLLTSPMTYYYCGKVVSSSWGFDLIIDEKYRKDAWGIDMMMKNVSLHPQLLATGSGPKAKAINLKLGMKNLGNIRKYVGIVNPLFLFTSLKRKAIESAKFPDCINNKQNVFYKVNIERLPEFCYPFNNDLLEIAREPAFMRWRFFNDLHQYAFYVRNDGGSYFVVRSILIKGFRVMALVDFRCKNAENEFEDIYQAAAKVTRQMHLPVMVCGSSLKNLDMVLERHHFKSIGRPRPVLGFLKCNERKQDIEDRNFCFVTLADSDGETNWI